MQFDYFMKFKMKLIFRNYFRILILLFGFGACNTGTDVKEASLVALINLPNLGNKGIGPVAHLEMKNIDVDLAKRGEGLYRARCISCHKLDQKYIGPALKGIGSRRSPEWIMNMMLNPLEMTQKDSIAKKLLSVYSTQMNIPDLNRDDALAILEYLRNK